MDIKWSEFGKRKIQTHFKIELPTAKELTGKIQICQLI